MRHEQIQVACHSGYTYAGRPMSFVWEGAENMVKEVEKEWQEPGERHFKVRTEDDRRFELCYYDSTDRWSATEWV
ncbi:MAG: hypothetical protein V3S51_03745 [Dehalococcoidia bacterium]